MTAGLIAGGCGYQPLYGGGKNSPASREMAFVRVEPIADRIGQQLRNELLDLLTPLGQPSTPKYALEVTLSESKSELAVKKSEVATRANLSLRASYTLRNNGTGKNLYGGNSTIVGSYNILTSDFSNIAAEQGVRDRLVEELARDIQLRLSAYFRLPAQR
ncbi:MAG: LPS assembly lipoprotein LptE [Rhodospirillales bacterium]|nr:LPS assembly lipoprotein LptE [Rhodospirillales bacterium]